MFSTLIDIIMNVQITHNTAKNGIEMLFSKPIENELLLFLEKLGFKHAFNNKLKWYADFHPPYVKFANSLESNTDWKSIPLHTSFEPTYDNADNLKFCITEINVKKDDTVIMGEYLIFENYKRVATIIAERFAKETFGHYVDSIVILPRNYKTRAQRLLRKNKVIEVDEKGSFVPFQLSDSLSEIAEEVSKNRVSINLENVSINNEASKFVASGILENETDFQKLLLLEVIDKLASIEIDTNGNCKDIIQNLTTEIEEASAIGIDSIRREKISQIIRLYKDWFNDLDSSCKTSVAITMRPLLNIMNEKLSFNSCAVSLHFETHKIQNVLVPIYVQEVFHNGMIPKEQIATLKPKFPYLFETNNLTFDKLSAFQLFELSQLEDHIENGINISRIRLNNYWQDNSSKIFKEIDYPIDKQYPYVSLSHGYIHVYTLEEILVKDNKLCNWLHLLQNYRPIADLSFGIDIINKKINKLSEQLTELKKGESLINMPYQENVSERKAIEKDIASLFSSKQVIERFIEQSLTKQLHEDNFVDSDNEYAKLDVPEFNRDSFVAGISLIYSKHKKPTEAQIEDFSKKFHVLNDEVLQESIELSAIAFFRNGYNHLREEFLVGAMSHFWRNLQYERSFASDKEQYEHSHILPLPIAMMIGKYIQSSKITSIYDPTAGSGHLLVGLETKKVHANEVSELKRTSLDFLRFKNITSYNPLEPTPKEMHKSFDAVICNPPNMISNITTNQKDDIIDKYIENKHFLNHYLRQKAYIIALALLNLKNDGKAVIVLDGHIIFDEEGRIKYYRGFLNWLYKYYCVRDIINLDSFILSKDTTKTQKKMLVLIEGRKENPRYDTPTKENQPHLANVVGSLDKLWERFKTNQIPMIDIIIKQLKIANKQYEK
ncbi:DNA methyltransferase family protein [Kordia algicida]|uniref:SAM-dependent DNA methyltransferase n=1 Tax=Kordia algicida TaxID=221066 RepID=UPI001EE689B6|nr:SAM-dependent DNA methyltransferase [Kordia algicida]